MTKYDKTILALCVVTAAIVLGLAVEAGTRRTGEAWCKLVTASGVLACWVIALADRAGRP